MSSAAGTGAGNAGTIRVGRWMSRAEHQKMMETGRMQEGAGGSTSVATSGPDAFYSQAPMNSVFVEFDVAKVSLLQGGRADWYKAVGEGAPRSMKYMLEKQGGEFLPQVSNLSGILRTKP